MPDYKFDGTYLEKASKRLAKVNGDYVEDPQADNRRVAKINGDYVEDSQNGCRRVAKLNGDYVEDCLNGSRRVAKLDGIKKTINGYPSKMQTVAMC